MPRSPPASQQDRPVHTRDITEAGFKHQETVLPCLQYPAVTNSASQFTHRKEIVDVTSITKQSGVSPGECGTSRKVSRTQKTETRSKWAQFLQDEDDEEEGEIDIQRHQDNTSVIAQTWNSGQRTFEHSPQTHLNTTSPKNQLLNSEQLNEFPKNPETQDNSSEIKSCHSNATVLDNREIEKNGRSDVQRGAVLTHTGMFSLEDEVFDDDW